MRWFSEPALQRIAGPGLIAGATLVVTLFFASLAIERASPVQTALLDPAAFRAEEGLAFTATVPLKARWPFAIQSDAPGTVASRLLLTEDGRALGPSHAPHNAIRSKGQGQYSHWRGMVLFSSSRGIGALARLVWSVSLARCRSEIMVLIGQTAVRRTLIGSCITRNIG